MADVIAIRRRSWLALSVLAFAMLAASWTVWQRGQAVRDGRFARFEANIVGGWDVYDSFAWTALSNQILLPYNIGSTLLDALGCAALAAAWSVGHVRAGWKIAAGVPFVLSTGFHGLCLFINWFFGS